jgi:hypothetical protein
VCAGRTGAGAPEPPWITVPLDDRFAGLASHRCPALGLGGLAPVQAAAPVNLRSCGSRQDFRHDVASTLRRWPQ